MTSARDVSVVRQKSNSDTKQLNLSADWRLACILVGVHSVLRGIVDVAQHQLPSVEPNEQSPAENANNLLRIHI